MFGSVPSHTPQLRLWRGISIGPDGRKESAEDKGNEFYKEGRYQDAVDAYSLALVYNVSARTLSNRSQAYLKLGNQWLAYIDANEAVKLDDSLVKAWYRRGATLEELGFYNEAKKSLQACVQLSPEEKAAKKILKRLEGKKADEPKIDPGKVKNYDPLESDSVEYGREFFLGDLNRYLLNKRVPPADPNLKKFRYGVQTWKTAPQLADTFASLLDASRVEKDWADFATLHMCFSLDHAAVMARCVGNLALQNYLLGYTDACVGLDGALKLQYPEGVWRSAMYKAVALQELGFTQRAKKALEPALRLAPHELEKDEPKIDAALLDNIDPLAGEGFAYEQRRRIYPALLRAMQKVYYEEPGPYWPSTSIRELEWYIINEAHRSLRTRKCADAAFLFSTVINVSDRKDFYLLTNRAQAYLWIPARKLHYKAYIDASEAFKLDPTFRTALFFKATALTKLGFIERARQCFRQMRQINPRDDEVHQLLAQVAGVPDHPLIDEKKLDNYDPRDADESLVESDRLEQQIDAIRDELQAEKDDLSYVFCRYLDAFTYAVRAAHMDPTFLEAVELKGRCLAAMGFFTNAHACLREVLKCNPKNDDVKQLLGSIKNERDRPTEDPSSIEEIEEE